LIPRPLGRGYLSEILTKSLMLGEDFTLDPREIEYLQDFHIHEIEELVKTSSEKFAPTFIVAIKKFLESIKESNH